MKETIKNMSNMIDLAFSECEHGAIHMPMVDNNGKYYLQLDCVTCERIFLGIAEQYKGKDSCG